MNYFFFEDDFEAFDDFAAFFGAAFAFTGAAAVVFPEETCLDNADFIRVALFLVMIFFFAALSTALNALLSASEELFSFAFFTSFLYVSFIFLFFMVRFLSCFNFFFACFSIGIL